LTYEYVNFYNTTSKRFSLADLLYFTLISKIEKYAYEHADALIAVSNFEKKFIEKTRRKNVHVITNGIDLSVFSPDANGLNSVRHLTQSLKGKKIVTFVGRMVHNNGILVLARAIPKVVSERNDVLFLIVGDGFGRDEFYSIISKAHVSSRVMMVGEKSNPAPYYKISDLFVSHVSSLMEGVGLTVLEAIACGVPVIVGNDPVSFARLKSVAHFVKKDDSSALAGAILALLDQDLRSEKAELRRFAEARLGLDATFQKYLEVFNADSEE
jgi:glycosyltransferase involved in cell wall biosynthesis